MTRCCICRYTHAVRAVLEPTDLPGSGYRCTDRAGCAERVRETSMRLIVARINLRLAYGWSHVAPSARQRRIEELHDELNTILTEAGY